MNKKTKWAIPFAVLALTCGVTAGALTGCKKHTHSYTEYGHDETWHWMECECGDIDESSKEHHEFTDGVCECGATKPIDKVTVTITNGTAADANGTISIDKTTAHTGDTVKVTITPAAKYQLKNIKVNGDDYSALVEDNVLTFDVEEGVTAITVVAEFEKIANASINAEVAGKKYGDDNHVIADNTAATLTADGVDPISATLQMVDGKLMLKVDEVVPGTYKLTVADHAPATLLVKKNTAYTDKITLQYDLMENLCTSWGQQDTEDLSNQNEGKIRHTSGYWQWVSTNDAHKSVAFTATAVKGGARQGVFVRFKGETYNKDEYVLFGREGDEKIGRCDAGDGLSKGVNLFENRWGKEDLITPAANESYDITVVRDGADLYFFVDGEFILKETLDVKYTELDCYVGLYCGNAEGLTQERTFKIEDASKYLDVAITDETPEEAVAHGTVNIDTPAAKLGDEITVTLTPSSGYKVKDLKINGDSVLAQMSGKTYKFTATKNATVLAEFEESQTVNSVAVTVTPASGWTATGTEITFAQLDEICTGTVGEDNTVTLGTAAKPVALGVHTVYANFGGYKIKLGTATVEKSQADPSVGSPISLDLKFTGSGIEADSVTAANPSQGSLTYQLSKPKNAGAYNNKYDVETIENGGFFAYKVKFNKAQETLSLILRTGDNAEIIMVVQNNNAQGKGTGWGINWKNNSMFKENQYVDFTGFESALTGSGLWLVLHYDAATGEADSYIGTELTSMRYAKSWENFSAGLKFNGFGVGCVFGGHTTDDTADVTFKYGETMQAIGMVPEQEIQVNASLAAGCADMGEVALSTKNGKYYKGTQATLTVTAAAFRQIKSIKVGDAAAVEDGWTGSGNVYTYTFTIPENDCDVVVTMVESPKATLTGVKVDVTDGTNKIDLGATVSAKLTPAVGDAYTVELTRGADGVYTFGGEFYEGDYRLTLVGKYVGYPSVDVKIAQTVGDITVTYKLTSTEDKGPRSDASITVTKDKITIVGTQENAFAEWASNHNDNQVPYVTLNLSDEAKNAKNVMLEFNLKTSNQCGYFINGFGVGMTGFNGLRMLFANTATKDYTPDGKISAAILNGRKMGEDNISAHETIYNTTYGWIETLALTTDGVNIRALRQGTSIKFYAENADGNWVLIKFAAPVNGDYGNLQYVDHLTVAETDLNDIRFIANGATWDVSAITITLNPEINTVDASFEGSNSGYAIKLDNALVGNNGTAKIEIYANPDTLGWSSWSKAPTSVKVNGVEKITECVKTSQGSNKATWTLNLTGINADTSITVTIGAAQQVELTASVAVADTGVVVTDGNEYYWNDACDLYMNAAEGYELNQIKITFGTGDDAEVIIIDATDSDKWSEGTFNKDGVDYKYKYSFNVKASATVEVTYTKVTTTAE